MRRPELLQQSDSEKIDLSETLRSARLPLTDATIEQHISRNLDTAGAKKRSMELRNNTFPTHAEVRMVLYMLQSCIGFDEIFPYFGCSKLSFKCHALCTPRCDDKADS